MFNTDSLFAGMESALSDVEINNDVTVPTEDTAEDVADDIENEEVAAEGAEVEQSVETEEVKDQMIANNFDIMLSMYDVAKTRGIDATFLALFNRNGGLNDMVNVQFPSCESMDVVGDPNGAYSRAFVAAMEADDGIFKRIWEWIKKVCAKIRDFFVRIWDWIAGAFGSLTRKIGTLQARLAKSKPKDDADLKGKKLKIYNETKIEAANKRVKGAIKDILGDSKTVVTTVKDSVTKKLITKTSGKAYGLTAAEAGSNYGNTSKSHKKYDEKLSKLLKKVKESLGKIEKKEIQAVAAKKLDLQSKLNAAKDLVNASAQFKNDIQDMKNNVDRVRAEAERNSQMSTGNSLTSDELKSYKEDTSALSKASSAAAKAVAYMPKLASYNCQIVAAVLSECYTSAGTGPDSKRAALGTTAGQ